MKFLDPESNDVPECVCLVAIDDTIRAVEEDAQVTKTWLAEVAKYKYARFVGRYVLSPEQPSPSPANEASEGAPADDVAATKAPKKKGRPKKTEQPADNATPVVSEQPVVSETQPDNNDSATTVV